MTAPNSNALILRRLKAEIGAAQNIRAGIVSDLEAAERHILALQDELTRVRAHCADHHIERNHNP